MDVFGASVFLAVFVFVLFTNWHDDYEYGGADDNHPPIRLSLTTEQEA